MGGNASPELISAGLFSTFNNHFYIHATCNLFKLLILMALKTIFKDLRVIELANILAGPAVGMFFAELGAQVLKIENKTTEGDLTRQWKLASEDPTSSVSAYYASVNLRKEIRMIDLGDPAEREEVYNLIRDADVVISNFLPQVAERLGMTHQKFRQLNPRIIVGSVTAYGEDDPRPGFDLVLQAESGFMSMNGTTLSGPLKMPVALIDLLAAHQLKEGLLLALIQRQQSGVGCTVSVSLLDAAITSLANQASNYLTAGFIPGLSGSLHPNIAPYGEILRSRDGKDIVLAVGNDKQFEALCKVLEIQVIASDVRFSSNRLRIENRSVLGEYLATAASAIDSGVLLDQLSRSGVPSGMIKTIDEVFKDPHSQQLILEEKREGVLLRGVSTLAFREMAGLSTENTD